MKRLNNVKTNFSSAYHRLVLGQIIGEATLIYPLYSIMFGERSGITPAGVGILLAVWQITQIVAEVPTGIIADRFSKKYSIVLGRLLKTLCFGVWFFAPNYTGYLLGFMLWGIGEAFISGAVQAYLYELNDGEENSTYLKSYSRLKSYEMFTYTITYFVTFLIGPKYQLLVGLSILSALFSFFMATTLPTTKPLVKQTTKDILKSAKHGLFSSRALRIAMLEGLLIGGTMGMLIEFITVNYHHFGASTKVTPLLISGSALFSGATFWALHYYQRFFRKNTLKLLLVFLGFYLVTFGMSTWWQILGLFAVTRYMRVLTVVQESEVLERAVPAARATVMSSFSLLVKLMATSQIVLVGFLAVQDKINIPTLWFIVLSLGSFATVRLYDGYFVRSK
jgi:MFS family permease